MLRPQRTLLTTIANVNIEGLCNVRFSIDTQRNEPQGGPLIVDLIVVHQLLLHFVRPQRYQSVLPPLLLSSSSSSSPPLVCQSVSQSVIRMPMSGGKHPVHWFRRPFIRRTSNPWLLFAMRSNMKSGDRHGSATVGFSRTRFQFMRHHWQ